MKQQQTWVCEEGQFKDYELDFPYRIIHTQGDNNYLDGTLGSALSEFAVFKDLESFAYFYGLLVTGSVLIPVDVISDNYQDKLHGLSAIATNKELNWQIDNAESGKDVKIIPTIFPAEGKRFMPIFTSMRQIFWVPTLTNKDFLRIFKAELSKMSPKDRRHYERFFSGIKPKPGQTFMYINFIQFYYWICENAEQIDFVVFDVADKWQCPLAKDILQFIYEIECAIGHFAIVKNRLKGWKKRVNFH